MGVTFSETNSSTSLLEAANPKDEMSRQMENLIRVHDELVKSNSALQAAFLAKIRGQMCMHEIHQGVVTDVSHKDIEVAFDTENGVLRQIYSTSQFIPEKIPQLGDTVTTYVIVVSSSKKSDKMKEDKFDRALPNFGDRAVTGPIRI